jgi:hypothetical protein
VILPRRADRSAALTSAERGDVKQLVAPELITSTAEIIRGDGQEGEERFETKPSFRRASVTKRCVRGSAAVTAAVVAARRLQGEGMVDDDDAAAFRCRKLQRFTASTMQFSTGEPMSAAPRPALLSRRDDEVDDDAARSGRWFRCCS